MSITEMSLSGGVMILAVTVIRALAINRLPKDTFLALWGVAVLRLLAPFTLPSALSVYSLFSKTAADAGVLTSGIRAVPVPEPGNIVPGMTASSFPLWRIVWIAGSVACALFFAFSYLRCFREFQTSLPAENETAKSWLSEHRLMRPLSIRQSDRISSPLTYGICRPVILMPKRTRWEDERTVKYVLAHEYIHIRRFDAVKKLILTAALCLHWFNPLVWVMFVLANRDIELSCDEAVVRLFGESERAEYARALISMEEAKSGFTPLCTGFSRNAIEERITAIMKIKKTTIFSLVLALLIVVGTATAFATSAPETESAVEGAIDVTTVMSYVGDDGKTYFSFDEGETFEPMTDSDYDAAYAVEWWTYEEFAQWLEEEKVSLQSLLGTTAWTSTDGEFVWTQEKIDETIAMYEQVLEDIGNGMLYSKSVNGSDDVLLCMSTDGVGITTSMDVVYSDNTQPAE